MDFSPELHYSILNPVQTANKLLADAPKGLMGALGRGDRNSKANIEKRKDQVLSAMKTYFPDNPNAWAGLMANVEGENSKFDFQKEETADVKNKGYGLFQFTKDQRTKYFTYLLETGIEDSPSSQVGYLHHLLYDRDPTYEVGDTGRNRIRHQINIGSAYGTSDSLVDDYEKSKNQAGDKKIRHKLTRGWVEKLNAPPLSEKQTPIKPYNVFRNR